MEIRIFRWRAIGPLLLLLVLLGIGWLLFGDWLVEETSEEASTELLGTQVDISGLHLRERDARVEIAGLQVADPFNPMRNLLESGSVVLDLDPEALLEKKLVINQLRVESLRLGTTRTTPARPVQGGGFAPTLLSQVRQWTAQFDVPLLTLTGIDTVRQLALNPEQLSTVREATALVAAADSVRDAFTTSVSALDIRPALDTARAVAERLAGANPARLGVSGTRDAVQSVRRALDGLDQARQRIEALEQGAGRGVSRLQAGVEALDQARQRDYDFARGLLQLPSFAAPEIGKALFGRVSLDRVEQAMYWAELGRKYLPPGLQPRTRPGSRPLRAGGTTVAFPKIREFPAFLLRQGVIDVAFEAFGGRHTLAATAAGITTQPTLYGRPATVSASGTIGGRNPMRLSANALVDHTDATPRDSVRFDLAGVPLPSFDIPGLPFRVDPGTGASGLDFTLAGDRISARWRLASSEARWSRDTSATGGTLEGLIWRVLSGLNQLDITAEVSGTIRAPSFAVHSNVDQAIADRVQAVIGEEIAAAEARVRAQVDQLISRQREAAQARVQSVSGELNQRVAEIRREADDVRDQLQARLRALTGGLGGVLGLPGS